MLQKNIPLEEKLEQLKEKNSFLFRMSETEKKLLEQMESVLFKKEQFIDF